MPRSRGTSNWKNIGERADQGEYTLVDPLDYLALNVLKPEGTTFAGLYPIGHSVREINKEAFDGKVKNSILSPRMGSMHSQGLVVHLHTVGASGNQVWQITERGTEVLNEWLDKHPEHRNSKGEGHGE